MSSDPVQGAEFRLQRLVHWFHPESAAVVTILLGLFTLVLSASFFYAMQSPSKLFILSLVLGVLIVLGGSVTIANERAPNRLLLRGCVCSNVVVLMMALLSFCLYSYSLSSMDSQQFDCSSSSSESDEYYHYYRYHYYHLYRCPPEHLRACSWCVTVLLLLCDTGAVLTHSLLCVSAFRTLKHE